MQIATIHADSHGHRPQQILTCADIQEHRYYDQDNSKSWKRADPAMVHAYFEYMTSGYPRGAGHGMLLVQLHDPAAGQPWAPVGARRMLARAGRRAGLGAVKPHAFRHSFTSAVLDAAGAGACPPENSGGTGGFADLKEILVGPPGQAREDMRGPVKTTPRRASI